MDAAVFHEPRRRYIAIDSRAGGGEVAALDFGPADRPIDVVFLHANGFNALTYRTLLAPLSAGLRLLAVDQRGHGLTRLAAKPAHRRTVSDLRDDLVALLDVLDQPPLVLAGHSMGANVALLAGAERPARAKALVLLEPVILPPLGRLIARTPLSNLVFSRLPIVKAARKRRSTFPSREAAFSTYRGRGAFKTWPDIMVADYVAGGLTEQLDGKGFTLACDPAWEASNYLALGSDMIGALRRFRGPVTVLAGEEGSTCHKPSVAAALRRNREGMIRTIPATSHFLPMERPDLARDAVLDAALGPF